jgi:transcriptional regulator with XRE-family HTH domain
MKIGVNIRNIRKLKKVTQKKLADKLQIERSLISKYESGAYDIPTSRLIEIARALNVSPARFFSTN